ncbi:Zinc fingerC2H2 type family protein [Aphelenchoides avenae]|nr:Zinc fingerC2H2 type family protein [Aphelenchus avenae]
MATMDIAQLGRDIGLSKDKSYTGDDSSGSHATMARPTNTRSSSRLSMDSGFLDSSSFPASPDSSCSSAAKSACSSTGPTASGVEPSGMRPTDFRHIACVLSDEPVLRVPKTEDDCELSKEDEATPEPRPDLPYKESSSCTESPIPCTSSVLGVIDYDRQQCGCEWMYCESKFTNDNELYDHVIQNHIEPLRPSLKKPLPGPAGRSARLSGRRGSGSAPKAAKYKCHWSECEMCMTVGDEHKQFEWLLRHYTTRHAPKAQPFKCLFAECTLRFRLQSSLNDHLRNAHDESKNKGNKEDKKLTAPASCYAVKPRPSLPITRGSDCIDGRTMDWIRATLLKFSGLQQPCFEKLTPTAAIVCNSQPHGAQRRKRALPRLPFYDLMEGSTSTSPTRNDSDAENCPSLLGDVHVKQEVPSSPVKPPRKRFHIQSAQELAH